MKRILFTFLFCPLISQAATWLVGPTQVYTKPSQVSSLVNDGDTVLIDAATYVSDVCYWSKNNLVLKGVGQGYAHLDANGAAYGGKAIWVIGGNDTRVENIEFSHCTVADKNGAGIRQEGANLTAVHCYFHHNEMGLLAGDISNCKIMIEKSELAFNGYGDGYSHNIYINHIDTFVFQYNYSHDAFVGHEVKSRAKNNYILYNRITSESGTDSRNIDLPNGGRSFLIGNIINQQQASQNNNLVGYGLEGLANAVFNELYVINNTLVNEKNVGSFFDISSGTELFKAYNNVCAGMGTFYTNAPLVIDTMKNMIVNSYAALMFQDAANYQYQISFPTYGSSPLFNQGMAPGSVGSFSLSPQSVSVHPQNFASRCTNASFDIGAYEECVPAAVSSTETDYFLIYPNPARGSFYLSETCVKLKLFDLSGKCVFETDQKQYIQVNLPAGLYQAVITNKEGRQSVKRMAIQ
ncbi:MAG: T9SS type A sorting domain-containing protein [Chitinophagaceae bacterium]|nr:T9SS type A sorting domain-containing protein [Chitinophagaceae bacterium]